jgi:hypothetical protein
LIGSEFGDSEMKTVTLEVATLKDVKRRAQKAFKGRKQGARISFATPELLFRLMTAKRWELIRMMTGLDRSQTERLRDASIATLKACMATCIHC